MLSFRSSMTTMNVLFFTVFFFLICGLFVFLVNANIHSFNNPTTIHWFAFL